MINIAYFHKESSEIIDKEDKSSRLPAVHVDDVSQIFMFFVFKSAV